MDLVAYVRPSETSKEALASVRLYALLNHHRLAAMCVRDEARWVVLKRVYLIADGLIVPSLQHVTDDVQFLIAMDELRQRGKHFVSVADGIDTTLPGCGDAHWQALQSIARLARATKAATRTKRMGEKVQRTTNEPEPPVIPTLRQAWRDFRNSRKALKPRTVAGYNGRLNSCFGDWMDREITAITKNMVEIRHLDLTTNRGAATANISCRILRSVLNYSRAKYEKPDGTPLLTINPVSRLSEIRGWNREKPRERYLHWTEMKRWYEAVEQVHTGSAREYLLFLLFTGCRRCEAEKLKC